MPSFTPALLALAAVSLVIANPIPQAGAKTGFTVNEATAKPFQAGPVMLRSVYAKYGVAPPSDVEAAASGQGAVSATPEQYDAEYLCPVTIGGQTVNLDFDTGSADLWVFSAELSASEQSGHSVYNPNDSDTAQRLDGYTWNITYGDGSGASGDVYTDDVTVGSVTVTGQAVELATQISAQFTQDTANDGLLGLAFSSINTVQPQSQTTFFDTAISEGVLNENVFTVDLKKGRPGSYDFGFIDSSKHTGSITYVDIDSSNGFWEFSGSGYGVGSSSFTSTSIDAIADTGTTLLLMDDSIVSAYYGQVSGASYDSNQGGYTFPCSTTLPSFTLGIGSYRSVIPGSYMNYSPATGSKCFGGLQSNTGIGFNIYGDIWLKSQFVVFDSDNTRLGVAPKNL